MRPVFPASRQWLALPLEFLCLPTRGSARDSRHRSAETLANALRLFHWTIAKKTLEVPAELRCALIANSIYPTEVGVVLPCNREADNKARASRGLNPHVTAVVENSLAGEREP